jgi:hypothetical protein
MLIGKGGEMQAERLNRRRFVRLAGGAIAAGSASAWLGRDALATASAASGSRIGVLVRIDGAVGVARADAGAQYEGTIQSLRRLHAGDRVLIEDGAAGSTTITALYTEVEGRVQAHDDKHLVVNGNRYLIDAESATRTRRGAGWVDSGPVGRVVKKGVSIQALCITNTAAGSSTVAMAWV